MDLKNNHPKDISIKSFYYDLPEKSIALYPAQPRDSSKLLIYEDGDIKTDVYINIHRHLPKDSLLVFNNTKVVEARLLFKKATGSSIEIFCLEPDAIYGDITTAMMQKEKVNWKCLVGGAKKWKDEVLCLTFHVDQSEEILQARKIKQEGDTYLIDFTWNNKHLTFAEVLHYAGNIPLPPYIKRSAEEHDKVTYQTIYAQEKGSVAAPTAGLHFTENVLQQLNDAQISFDFVTLHVGAGTFMPVKADTLSDHTMHAEFLEVSLSFVEELMHFSHQIIPVGTTSLRTLESLYWMGVKTILTPHISHEDLMVAQWEAYELPQQYSRQEAMSALKDWMIARHVEKLIIKTQILIAPGYILRMADAIITNFHQPQSTLLLLIYTFVQDDWRRIYEYALHHDFRFLSYGDGSLLWARKKG